MDIPERVETYLASQPQPKQTDLRRLHTMIRAGISWMPAVVQRRHERGQQIVANPNVGYGVYTIINGDGSWPDFYRIGLSATRRAGISVYVLGLDDKTYLARTYGTSIGKASVTGYCIRIKRLSDINVDARQAAIRHDMTIDQTGGVQP